MKLHLRTTTGLCALFALLLSAFSLTAAAQQPEATADTVLQANARLTAAVKDGTTSAVDTASTLVARHAALEQIFRNTPALARSYALDAETRAALIKANPANAALLEREQKQTGELVEKVGDDFVNNTVTHSYSLHTMTADLALSFTNGVGANEARLVHHQVTVSGLGLEDIIATETIREATPAEVGAAQAVAFALQSTSSKAATSLTASAPANMSVDPAKANPNAIATGSATALCTQTGPQNTAIVILNFAGGTPYPAGTTFNTQAYWNALFNGPTDPAVANVINETSYGQTTAIADVLPPITLAQAYDCTSTDAMSTAAFAAMQTAGVDFTKYNRYIFVYSTATCNFGGLDTLGCVAKTATVPQQYSIMWMPITSNYTSTFPQFMFGTVAHEYGHALGLSHSNTLDFGALTLGPLDYTATNPGTVGGAAGTGNPPAATATIPAGTTSIGAINTEYGDLYAMMGNSWTPAGPYAGQHRAMMLGWIPPSTGSQAVTTSGTYTLAPTETNTGLRTLQILRDPSSGSWIWVEYHQPLGVYEPLSLANLPANNLTTGAELHYQNGFGILSYTLMMNMAPTVAPNNFFNANLAPNSSWSDPFSLLTIKTGAQTATALPITVSYDTPCATLAISNSQFVAAGATGTITVTAPGTCAWQASSNGNWISFTGTTSGTGNGTVPFTVTANTNGNQRNSYITVQRQSLPVVQAGTAISIMGVSPTGATMAPNVQTAYTFTINDPAGAADFGQITATFVGNNNADCSITANANGTGTSLDMQLMSNGVFSNTLTTGSAGQLTNGSCTVDGPGSSFSTNGNTITVVFAVSFPTSFQGVHAITASAGGQTAFSSVVPVGYVNVAPITATVPTISMTPGFGNQGTTVPIAITGFNTSFTGASTITLAGPGGGANGITVTGLTAASATSLTANLVIPTAAATGAYTLTVTSGAQTATATFTVNAAPVPIITIAPNAGDPGTTVNAVITGVNTNFTAASTVLVGGGTNGVIATPTFVNATTLNVTLTIAGGAPAGPQNVVVTSGAEVDTVPFTVNAPAAATIAVAPAAGTMGSSVPITITGTNTAFAVGSTVTVSGANVSVTNVTILSSTSLTATVVIAGNAAAGARTLTVTTGAQTATATFTVNPAPVPVAAVTPTSGSVGTTVPVTITGNNTSYSLATVVTASGGITVSNVSVRDTGYLTASLVIPSTATAGPITLTITTGAQVVTTTFTVQALAATTATVAPSATTIVPAQTLTLVATVAPTTGNGKPTGQVSFLDSNGISPQPVSVATLSLAAGTASASLKGLTIGTHSYTLQYFGDGATYAPTSTATPVVVTVAKGTPTVTLTGVTAGTLFPAGATGLTLTATIGGGTTGVTPTGSVIFLDGATQLGTVNLTAGVAQLTAITLATGAHSITAQYSGDSNFVTLTPAAMAVAVQDFSLSLSSGTVTTTGSQSSTTTLTVTPASGGFTSSIALTCTGAPTNSTCTLSPATVTPGTAATMATVTIVTGVKTSFVSKPGEGVALGMLLLSPAWGLLLYRRRKAIHMLLVALFAVAALSAISGCGTAITTANGTYPLTVTATSTSGTGTLTHTASISLGVQ